MVDFILWVFILMLASFTAKLDIDKRTYITLRTIIFMIVLLGIVIVLNGLFGSEMLINISNSLKSIGIGYPRAWVLKTTTFKNEMIGCYYLVLLGIAAMSLSASAYEHNDMERYRNNGKDRNIFFVVTGALVIWGFFYMRPPTGSRGMTNKFLNQVYNSEILLLGWGLIWLALAIYYGKSLKVIFNRA